MISKYTITKNRLFFTLTFVVCVQYSFAHQLGLYGYGTDYRYFYSTRENMLVVTKIIDNLGFFLATLTINQIHLGVLVTSMLYSISNLYLFNVFLKERTLFLLLSVTLCLHTWPLIMGVSNGMRQAIMASFLSFAVARAYKTQKIPIVLIFLSVLSHNSGLFFCCILIFALMQAKYLNRTRLYLIIFGICGFLTILYCSRYLIVPGGSRVIGGDFRYPFLLINFSIALFLFLRRHLTSPQLFLFYANFCAPAIFMVGGNYEYERLNQVLILLNIVILANMFKSKQSRIIVIAIMFLFVGITYATGMFSGLQ